MILGTSAADGKHNYLKNWTWWAGMGTSKRGAFDLIYYKYISYLLLFNSGCR
jgi:hypothetical protein